MPAKKHHHKNHDKHSPHKLRANILDWSNVSEFSDDGVSPASNESLSPLRHEQHHSFSAEEKVKNLTVLNETLVKHISSLQSDIEKLKKKAAEITEKAEENEQNRQAFLRENLRFEQGTQEALLEIAGLRKSMSSLEEENAALQAEQFHISDVKQKCERALKSSQKELEESRKELKMAQAAAYEANSRIDTLNTDIVKCSCGLKTLNGKNASMKMLIDDKDSVLQQLEMCIGPLKQENYVLTIDMEKALEDTCIALTKAEYMRSKECKLREKNIEFEKASRDSLKHLNSLSNQKANVDTKIHTSLSAISDLHKKLDHLKSRVEESLKSLQLDQELNSKLEKDICATFSENRSLRNEINSVDASISVLRVDTREWKNKIAVLEDQISAIKAEKVGLESSKIASELEAKRITAVSNDVMKLKKAEVLLLQKKAQLLETAISQKALESKSSLTKICQVAAELRSVESYLKEQTQSFSYTGSLAAISLGTLALTSLFGYFRSRKL